MRLAEAAWAVAIVATSVLMYIIIPMAGEFHTRVSMPLPPRLIKEVPGGLEVVAAPRDPFSLGPLLDYRVFASGINVTPTTALVLRQYLKYMSPAYSATHNCTKAAELLGSRAHSIDPSLAAKLCRIILRSYETAPAWMRKLSLIQAAYFNMSRRGVVAAVVYPRNGTVLFTRFRDYGALAEWVRKESLHARVGVLLNAWYSFSLRKYLERLANETDVILVVPTYRAGPGEDDITRLAGALGINCTIPIIVNGRAVPRLDYNAYYAVVYKGAVVEVFDDPRCVSAT